VGHSLEILFDDHCFDYPLVSQNLAFPLEDQIGPDADQTHHQTHHVPTDFDLDHTLLIRNPILANKQNT